MDIKVEETGFVPVLGYFISIESKDDGSFTNKSETSSRTDPKESMKSKRVYVSFDYEN